ncbi:MAG TPA: haloacid dehalogenase type II [Devosia sp.]|jgi:2-haloacid dehalogenase|nr:haloacid dehalogenase type II [Devosia sp.]
MTLRALLFDVYGTLLDVHGLTDALEAAAPGQGAALSALWRQKQIDYTRLRTMSGRYVPFDEITADGLDAAAERLGVHLTAPQRRELLTAYETLAPHPEVRVALEALAATGMRLGVLSNGTPAMLRTAISAAGLAPLLPIVLSVDAVHAYKTAAAAYQLGPEAFALPVGDIGFVSSNAWDAVGATWFGYRVFWVNRVREPMERLGVSPEATGRSLADVGHWVAAARA